MDQTSEASARVQTLADVLTQLAATAKQALAELIATIACLWQQYRQARIDYLRRTEPFHYELTDDQLLRWL